jgi:hypothetical protein
MLLLCATGPNAIMGGPLPRAVNHASDADLCVEISERMRAVDADCGL